MAQKPYDYATRKNVRPISWEDFHGICKALALAVTPLELDLILPIGRGGYYPGTLLAHMLQTDVFPVRVSRRVHDVVTYEQPHWLLEPPAEIAGRRVLIVDEICDSGETLRLVKEKAAVGGAALIKSAVLYAHTWSATVPDYIGVITDALVLNPWDREIVQAGQFHLHPEYQAALAQQNKEMEPNMLIAATPIYLAKG